MSYKPYNVKGIVGKTSMKELAAKAAAKVVSEKAQEVEAEYADICSESESVHGKTNWLMDCLVDWLFDSPIDWLIDGW